MLNLYFDMSSQFEILRINQRSGGREGEERKGAERRCAPRFRPTLKRHVFERFIVKSASGFWYCCDTKAKNGMGRQYQ